MKKRNKLNRSVLKKLFLYTLLIFIVTPMLYAQELTITGTVKTEDGSTLPGVNVVVQGTTTGTITDVDGKFTLTVPSADIVLVFSYVGYQTHEVTLAGQTVVNVTLTEAITAIDEIVVIGYGTLERSRMTTSVSKIDDRILENVPRSNVGTALQGSIPGLRVVNISGQPGLTPSIVMRGGTEWDGSGSPIVIIDGVVSSLYALNSEDIASVEVLKDAAATSIYGARAANGVILITTKRGKKGDAQVRYSYKFGLNKPRMGLDYVGAEDYIKYNRLAWKKYVELTGRTNFNTYILNPAVGWTATGNTDNSTYTTQYLTPENEYLLNEGWKKMKDPLYGQNIAGINFDQEYIIFQDHDMVDLYLQDSYVHDHHLSLLGGGEQGTYALGIGYMDDKGICLGSGFKRITGNLNADYQITKNIKISSTISYANSSLSNTFVNRISWIFQRYAGQPPTSRIYNADGSLNPGLNISFGNPLYYKDKFLQSNLEQRIRTALSLDWNILPKLKFTLSGNYFNINNTNESFNKAFRSGGTYYTDRNAASNFRRNQTMQFNAMLKYSTSFTNGHSISALLGTEYYDYNLFTMETGTRGSPTDLIPTMNVASEPRYASSFYTGNRLLSALGRVNYDYQLRYLVQFNFRYDGSSKLADNKWGFFPGISVGWNIHNESFYTGSGISNYITTLKPRISYGVNGNVDNLSDFGVFGSYSLSPIYNGQRGYYNTSLPQLGLKWESSTTFNLGLDAGFFNDRIRLMADYFIRDVKDKVAPYALPYWTGFTSINTNIGTLTNKGFETELNARVIDQPGGFSWDVGATVYTVKNFVKKLPDNDLPKNRQGGNQIYDPDAGEVIWVGGLQEGERVGSDLVVAHIQEYIYSSDQEVNEHAGRYDAYHYSGLGYTRYPGNVAWKDVDKNDTIDYRDRVIIGRTTPDCVGGITTSLSYKGLVLFARADYQIGHLVYNQVRSRNMGQVQGSQNVHTEVLDSWTPDNPDTDVPMYIFVDAFADHGPTSARKNSRYWEKGDYLCLREITLSYNFPASYMPKFLKSVKLYLSGSNLVYFTKYMGALPESGGTDSGRYPLPRTYTMGINVTF